LEGWRESQEWDNEISPEISARPADKQELLERIQREWNPLFQMVQKPGPEQASRPGMSGWSVKDNLAHLAAWEQMMLRSYLEASRSTNCWKWMRLSLTSGRRRINGCSMKGTRISAGTSAERLRTKPRRGDRNAREDAFEEPSPVRYPDDPEQRPMLDWVIGNTYEHYREHRRYIEEILAPWR
jgi:hypothetical protein